MIANMKMEGKGFSGRVTLLFQTTMVQALEELDEAANMASVSTHSNDPLLSGEDRLQLAELMNLCTNLQKKVLDLEEAKTAQAKEIANLKKRVKKLEKRRKPRTLGLKRLRKKVEVEKVVSTVKVTTVSATTTTVDESTLAQTLIKIKAAKPKVVTTAATITTTVIKRSKARGVVVQEPSEFRITISLSQPSQLPQAKDKGKAKMVEPEKPLKKKD
ncbi:hypothetical protein Tco_1337143 [Tanacetum coccineum]